MFGSASVLHSREIIHVDEWMPGHQNDKTQARHAVLFNRMKHRELHPERVYHLYDANGQLKPWRGIYIIVDGGFHQWRCLQAPLKHTSSDGGWSKRLESVRKDSECTFGTLKKRFRVLRLPFLCFRAETIDLTFRACCALHNMLLRYDRLDSIGHRAGDWQTERFERRRAQLDRSRMDRTVVRGPNALLPGCEREDGYLQLRDALIKHFEIARAKKRVRWLHPATVCRVGEEGEEGEEGSEPELADGPESEEEWAVASEDETD